MSELRATKYDPMSDCTCPPPWGNDYTQSPLCPVDGITACYHCGHVGPVGEDHACACPYSDEDCPDHATPRTEADR